jgi:DNA-binding transcriptional LysR family regulator
LLPDLVAAILKKSPKVKIAISVQPWRQVCESVRSANHDFGIILAHRPPHNLVCKPLQKVPACVVAPAGHPLADKKNVSIRDLLSVAFIAEEKEGHSDSILNRFIQAN